MPPYSVTLRHRHYAFPDLPDLLAKATPLRSGDVLANIAAENDRQRAPAQTFLDHPLIPPEDDEVSALIVTSHDPAAFAPIKNLTVGQLREHLLSYETT